MKRKAICTVALCSAAVLSLGVFAGCHGVQNDPAVLKVTFMSKHEYTKDLEDLGFISEIEDAFTEKTGCTIQWNIIPIGDTETKGLQLTSQRNIPDVFIGDSYSDSVVLQNKDMFVELTDYINADRLPKVYAMFEDILEEDGVDLYKEAAINGDEIYGIPRVAPFASSNVTFYMVNAAWIRAINETYNAGLLDPTPTEGEDGTLTYPEVTIAHFDAWVRAFHNETYYTGAIYNKTYSWYHDGEKVLTSVPYSQSIALDLNGEADMYNYITAFGNSLLGEKGVNDGLKGTTDDLFIRENASGEKEVAYKYTTQEVKYLAEYFRSLYADGVLNNEFITQEFSTMMGNSRNSTGSKVGCATGWSLADKFGDNADQYVVYRPLKGDMSFSMNAANEDPTLSNSGFGLKYAFNRYLITQRCAEGGKLDAALDLLDLIYDPVMSMKFFYGSSEDSFHVYTGTEVNEEGQRYEYEFTVPEGQYYDVWKWTNGFADYGLGYASSAIQAVTKMPEEHMERVRTSEEVYAPYTVEEGDYMPLNMKFTEEEQEFLDEYFSYLNNLGSTAVSQYVTGINKSSSWFEDLQGELVQYGVEELEALYKEKFDEYFAS